MSIAGHEGRTALIICDLQPDLLGSLLEKERFLRCLTVAVEAARANDWSIVYSGLRFPPGYEGVPRTHKLYGALARLNEKLGDDRVHWFLEGHGGSAILSSRPALAPREEDVVVWRSRHAPFELAKVLGAAEVNRAYVTGAKASGAVQIACQLLADEGIEVGCVADFLADDDEARMRAVVDHVLPVYATVLSLEEFMNVVGMETFSEDAKEVLIDVKYYGSCGDERGGQRRTVSLACDCGRRGHGNRYVELLRERGNWRDYPTQTWYQDFFKGEFRCPLFKKVVDFCDEPQFSKVAMFLKGRECLDRKDTVIEFAGRFMPKTYRVEKGKWVLAGDDDVPPADDDPGALTAPWFVKECDKNLGGEAIAIVSRPSEILERARGDASYVVQQHIPNPLLTDAGHKTHLKFYVLLACEEDGVSWDLYAYEGALLSISPNVWSPADLSHDTQVTIHRWPEPPGETEGWKRHWPALYEKCKSGTAEVIERAIKSGKLKGRPGKKQFEVFSVDWMSDTSYNVFMLEFNMSPAVSQQEFDDPESRDERRDYLMRHDEVMLREALAIVIPWEGGEGVAPGQWDFCGKFSGRKD